MSTKKKIISVVGARPNFIKLAPVYNALKKYDHRFVHKIVHTGQHYDYKLSQIFFKDLKLPEPDIYLGVGSSSHSDQTARIMNGFEKVLLNGRPDLVIVYGDVNSTLACSLVCSKFYDSGGKPVPVAHIEAGLRSFDRSMPEEVNRIVTDHISGYLFVTENFGVENLLREGIPKNKIFLVGDVMIDSLMEYREKFQGSKILNKLNLSPKKFILATLHRPVNVDDKKNIEKIISIFEKISALGLKIVFPVHPRTKKMFIEFGLTARLKKVKNLLVSEPFNYTDFIKLLGSSRLVITDSGGIQSEATFLKIPCLTLRDSLEKPEAIKIGTVTLCSLNINFIVKKVREILKGKYKKSRVPRLMDGKASERIAKIISQSI